MCLESNHESNSARLFFARVRVDHSTRIAFPFIFAFLAFRDSAFSCLVFSIFFSTFPSPRVDFCIFVTAPKFDFCAIIRLFLLLFARAPHRTSRYTHRRPPAPRAGGRDGAVWTARSPRCPLRAGSADPGAGPERDESTCTRPLVPYWGIADDGSDVRGPCARAGPTTEHVCHPQSPQRHRTATNARLQRYRGLGSRRGSTPRPPLSLSSHICDSARLWLCGLGLGVSLAAARSCRAAPPPAEGETHRVICASSRWEATCLSRSLRRVSRRRCS